jgi:hypothetical protein
MYRMCTIELLLLRGHHYDYRASLKGFIPTYISLKLFELFGNLLYRITSVMF